MNWNNTMGTVGDIPCVEILPDNQLLITLSVRMAESDLRIYPPLFVSATWGDYDVSLIGPLNYYNVTSTLINGSLAYEVTVPFTIDLDRLCEGIHPPTLSDFPYFCSLLTIGNGQLMPYPVLGVAAPLFPVTLFPEVGDVGFSPNDSGHKNLCCRPYPNDNLTALTTKGALTSASNQFVAFSVSPNPVWNDLKVGIFTTKAGSFQIDLLDLQNLPHLCKVRSLRDIIC
ncbi:MAG: hypothetical protein AAF985_03985 [Bacteroidota bacterium]